MSYLLCRQCNGYFELDPTESPHDFENCCCGGPLRYIKSITNFSKKIQSRGEDELDTDNTVVLYHHLRNFKDRISGYSDYDFHINEEHYYDPEYETSTDQYETVSNENESPSSKTKLDFSELMPYSQEKNNVTIPDLGELIAEYYDSAVEHYEDLESEISSNQYIENYESEQVKSQYEQDLEYIENEYYDIYSEKDLLFLSKKYIINHWATILAFGVLPLEYIFLFGNMPLNVMASFSVAVPLILSYLPRTAEIRMNEDVNRVCNVWVIYYVIFVLMILAWTLLNLVKMPLIYI